MHELVTLVWSHYNEKARWALDYCGIAYRERRYLPGLSQLAVMRATRGRGGRADRVSTRWSTPVLRTDDGTMLCDSTDIARWAAERAGVSLFPTPEVGELVATFGDQLGPYTRLVAYFFVMRAPEVMNELVARNVGRAQALVYRATAPIASGVLARSLKIDEARAERAIDKIRAQLAAVDARLARSAYLVGDRFTAADLTFAALLAPAVLVSHHDGYGAWLPELPDLPDEAREFVSEIRATRAARHAFDMYRRHRRVTASRG